MLAGGFHSGRSPPPALAADRSARRAHAMRCVARRAAHPRIDVIGVIVEARILHHLVRQVMTFSTQGIRPVYAQIWSLKQICNQPTRNRSLAHLIPALQDVRPFRPMRPICTSTAKLTVVIAVVAISA